MANPQGRARPRRTATRWAIRLGIVLGLGAAAGWVAGCVSTVTPPADPPDPATAYLVAAACHAGLVLPHPAGGFVDYAWGEWDWYALDHDRWYHVFDTVLWPTRSALGRRRLPAHDPARLRARYPGDMLQPFRVSRRRIARLRARLDARFRRGAAAAVYSGRFDLRFVPGGAGYWFLHNCNDTTAGWLRELGCSVSWVPVRLGLSLAPRTGDLPAPTAAAGPGRGRGRGRGRAAGRARSRRSRLLPGRKRLVPAAGLD